MPDYRGGPRQQSGYGQELVKAIREGRTERQRSRNFNQKLIFGAIQGGLAMGQGMAGSVSSHNAKMRAQEGELRHSADKYAAPEYTGRESAPPEWLGQSGEGNADLIQRADEANSRMSLNGSRELAPVGGQYTPKARENEDMQSSAMARDMQQAELGMRQANGINPIDDGMMGQGESGMYRSLPGRMR